MSGNWPAGFGRRVLAEIDSTNAEAMRLAPDVRGPEWILALHQTQGRGRRGRPWADPSGNFSATLLMHPDDAPDHVALRSFVAALALYDAFQEVTGGAPGFALKWPNDVLLNGRKLAGILLESGGAAGKVEYLCIGIGVNLSEAPEVTDPEATPPTTLAATGARITPEEFLTVLARTYVDYEVQFTTHGFAPIRTAWLVHAARLGEPITARTMRETLTGTFETVDDAGNLILRSNTGRHAIPAAEVFFEGGTDASGY